MDKYKTAELGRSLKRVFRAESRINDCLALAQKEIAAVFNTAPQTLEEDTDDGFYGGNGGPMPAMRRRGRPDEIRLWLPWV